LFPLTKKHRQLNSKSNHTIESKTSFFGECKKQKYITKTNTDEVFCIDLQTIYISKKVVVAACAKEEVMWFGAQIIMK
jgi:hypothetical protein